MANGVRPTWWTFSALSVLRFGNRPWWFRLVGRTSEISWLLISRVLFTARLFTQPDIALTTYPLLSPFSLLLR